MSEINTIYNTMYNTKDIIIIMLVLAVLYLIYKIHNIQNNLEKFTVTDDVKEAINDVYKADINSIRNLSNFATEIMNNNDSLTIPAKTTTTTNLVTTGDLTVNGNITFTNKNSNMIEIFPQYMVIAWASPNIPKGWALCNGKIYKLNNDGTVTEDSSGIQTPDLRGRFILGGGVPSENTTLKDDSGRILTSRNINEIGGEEKHVLSIPELPSHNHRMNWQYIGCKGSGCYGNAGWSSINAVTGNSLTWSSYTNPGVFPQTTGNEGGKLKPNTGTKFDGADQDYKDPAQYTTTPHENMPPFYVLTYIMKL